MSFNKEKLRQFENAILDETNQKISQLEEEVKEYEKREIEKAKNDDYNRMFNYMQDKVQEIKNKYRQDVTKYELQTKRSIFMYRNSLAEKVFDEVCEKLTDFTKSDKYFDYLVNKIEESFKVFPCDRAKLLVCKKDLEIALKLQQQISQIEEVVTDRKNTLGGFTLVNEEKGLLIDQTFSALIEEEKQKFYSLCGMTVNI